MNEPKFKLKGDKSTPHIDFDLTKNEFLIEGRSHPEDTLHFYRPVMDWLDKAFITIKKPGHFVFKLDYFNTASAKIIVDILKKIAKLIEKGIDFKVEWYYDSYDEDMKFTALKLGEITGVELKIVKVSE